MTRHVVLFSLVLLCATGTLSAQQKQATWDELNKKFREAPRPLELFQRLSGEQPENAWAWHFRGKAEDECGLELAAEKSFLKARDLNPNQAWHYQALADHWRARFDYERAEVLLQRAITLESVSQNRDRMAESMKFVKERADKAKRFKDELSSSKTNTWVAIVAGFLVLVVAQVLLLRRR